MSQEAVERFIGRLITDEAFREYARTDFQTACFRFGFNLTTDEQELIRNMDFEKFVHMEEGVDEGLKRWGELGYEQ